MNNFILIEFQGLNNNIKYLPIFNSVPAHVDVMAFYNLLAKPKSINLYVAVDNTVRSLLFYKLFISFGLIRIAKFSNFMSLWIILFL